MKAARRLAPLFPWFVPSLAGAAETAPVVQGGGFGALMQGLLGLLVVLAALFAFFWLLRRFAPGQTAAQGVVRVVGGVMLGTRERLVVVEVGDQWLLLGVGAGQVSHLHTMPRPAEVQGPEGDAPVASLPPSSLPPSFAAKLTEILARRKAP